MSSVRIFLFCLLAVFCCSEISAQSRIAGGQVINISNAPFIIQLRDESGTFMCGGTLVSPTHIVTAAHCFDFNDPSTVTIVGGANTIRDQGVKRKIVKFFKPDVYTRERLHMDVAVDILDSPMTGPNIRPVGLCDKALQPGDLTTIYGWGKMVWNGPPSVNLRTYSAPVVSQAECKRTYDAHHKQFPGTVLTVTNTMYCSFTPNKNACQHDSGSPALYGGKLCGIVSWGSGCENSEFPGVFTSIKAVRSYIDNALRS